MAIYLMNIKKLEFNPSKKCLICWLFRFLLAVGIMVLAVMIQPNSFKSMMLRFLAEPAVFALNLLPVFLLVVIFSHLLNNVFFGGALVNLIVCALSLANRIKVECRDEALVPGDFLLLREVGEAISNYNIKFPVKIILAVLLVTAALLAMGVVFRKRVHTLNIRGRLLWVLAGTLALVGLTMTLLASESIYSSFECTNSFYAAQTYNELGMPYSFFHNFTRNSVEKPEGFDLQKAQQWDEQATSSDGPPVHLIMIMSEAFTDMTAQSVFSYTYENDPISCYHSLAQNEHAISGYAVVSDFGAGTANTEFDVLTGIQSSALSAAATTSAFGAVTRNLDSMFRVYNDAGYSTSFLHPGYSWFYNRENTYKRFGAQRTIFCETMEDKVMKGTWITDDYVADLIISEFQQTVAEGGLMFNYTTTVQNHMAYSEDKYGENYEYPAVETNLTLSDDAQTLLKVYFEGLRDADAMLEKLVTYFSEADEPVVLAFWGDHYPNLGGSMSCYRELGLTENMDPPFEIYAMPYVIWGNDAAAEILDWSKAQEALGMSENGYISASFLGAAVLELCGRGDATPWYTYLNQLRRELPVVWWDYSYMDGSGNLLSALDEEQQSMIQKWRQWSYYKLRCKEIAE